MSLALRLGMTLGDLLAKISSSELTEWMAYFELEQQDQMRALQETASGKSGAAVDVRNIRAGFERVAARRKGK